MVDGGGGFTKRVRRNIRTKVDGIDLAADVDAVIAVNNGGERRTTVSRSTRETTVSQSRAARASDDSRRHDE
jgi:hypothetical protein